ncbi:MAG TPA: hypothetical protein VN873_12710 [Candidatus Angelobacter sp.]|nr:hypothetical protein [Candidatus Angelobacter sp.]
MMPGEQQKKGRGCLFWGGIVAAVLLLLALLTGYSVYRYVKKLVAEYTDTKPMEIPAVTLSQAEITNLQQRVNDFDVALKKNQATKPLTLTAEELNALIAYATRTNPTPVRLYFSFTNNSVQAMLSLPTDELGKRLGFRMLRGRYFNGSGDFAVSLHDGRLSLTVKSLFVKGRPLPEKFMANIRSENFADSWTNDVQLTQALAKLQEVKVEDGKLIVIPKPPETNAPPKTAPATNQPNARPPSSTNKPTVEKLQVRLEVRKVLCC